MEDSLLLNLRLANLTLELAWGISRLAGASDLRLA